MTGVEVLQVQEHVTRFAELPLECFDEAERILTIDITRYIEHVTEHEQVVGKLKVIAAIDRLGFQVIDYQWYPCNL